VEITPVFLEFQSETAVGWCLGRDCQVIVAVNQFAEDTPAEMALLTKLALVLVGPNRDFSMRTMLTELAPAYSSNSSRKNGRSIYLVGQEAGAEMAVVSDHFAHGGAGAVKLANAAPTPGTKHVIHTPQFAPDSEWVH
jgi:formyltetrahydrofolate synthetase